MGHKKVKIIIFGTGNYYRLSQKYIDMDYVICFVDNDPNKVGTFLDGKMVVAPENAEFGKCDYVLVLVMRYQSILEQLSQIGVTKNKIKLYPDLDDLFPVSPVIYSAGCKYNFNQWINRGREKKVMLICHELTRNGVSVVLMHTAQILKKMGYRPLMSALLEGELLEELRENNIDYISQINMFYGGRLFAELVRKMDFVIVGTIGIADVVWRIANTDVPIVWWIHESNDRDFYDFPLAVRNNVHYYAGGKRVVECFKRHYEQLPIKKMLYYLPDNFLERQTKGSLFRIGIIGLIYPRKAQDIFVEAVKEIPTEKKKNISFEIVGKYLEPVIDLPEVLKKNPEIKYIGEMSQYDLTHYFAGLDLLVCPSRDDPMPVVVTQAMQYGIPCIVSDQVGQSEYIIDGKNGFVFPSEDIEVLKGKIVYCIDHRSILQNIGIESRKVYEEYFSESAMEENLREIANWIGN